LGSKIYECGLAYIVPTFKIRFAYVLLYVAAYGSPPGSPTSLENDLGWYKRYPHPKSLTGGPPSGFYGEPGNGLCQSFYHPNLRLIGLLSTALMLT